MIDFHRPGHRCLVAAWTTCKSIPTRLLRVKKKKTHAPVRPEPERALCAGARCACAWPLPSLTIMAAEKDWGVCRPGLGRRGVRFDGTTPGGWMG